MFDKLIESNSEAGEFKPRRTYFMMSSAAVGLLFLAAVVASIYAGDISLGTASLELSELLAPVHTDEAPEPEPAPAARPTANQHRSSNVPSRTSSVQRISEIPLSVPETSAVPNTVPSRPMGHYVISNVNTEPSGPVGTARQGNGDDKPQGLGEGRTAAVADDKPAVPPPPPAVKRTPPTKHMGVVNGIATHLPKPPYPAIARTAKVQGKVDVQITIDETGKVTSARAVSGHPFLRAPAETAARSARFSPTRVSDVPVKVTGVIVYNFTM